MNKMLSSFEKQADSYESFQKLVEATNINKVSLLATDYLNHFNEIIMLIDMITEMPECIEDVAAWRPKTYQDHFRQSSFSHKDLAVAAYEYVPNHCRRAFEQTVAQLDALVLQAAGKLLKASQSGDKSEMATAALFGPEMRLLVERIGSIVNAETELAQQDSVDHKQKTSRIHFS